MPKPIRTSPLPYIGDIFKNDYDNPTRAKRKLNCYKMSYTKKITQASPQEKKKFSMYIKKIDKAIDIVGVK